ncbi:MAG TPA: MBL fold metallo-hydrolase [Candidatus Limnocylindria bacterium]|nr:MBL fold metallo-hydrolase [Candidatus Limnocylindria bacterium]
MRIQFCGATRTTTGSMNLLEVNEQQILLECGLYQGKRDESIERNRTFPFDPSKISAAIVSHSHIDHVGNFPNLCRKGFVGNIYCTFATRDLAAIMLEDSAQIQQDDAAFISRQRAKRGLPPVEPLYSTEDAQRVVQQFVTFNYDRPMPIANGVTLTFRDAGHILGSAQVVLDVNESGRRFRYLFSGDVGRGHDEILRDPEPVENVDYLQVESTYGGRDHTLKTDSVEQLVRLINETVARKGKVIIPTFAVGRTQQLVFTLHQLTLAGKIPRLAMFVDSPLSVNATEVFRLHPECFNEATYRFLREKANPFGMENLTYIREVAHSMKLNELKDPAIIMSASGMAEAGRIRHHLKNNICDPNNLILFVGYCAEHTLGAQIVSGRSPVNIFGEPYEVRARVASLDAFSGHADRTELKRYVSAIAGDIKKIAVVHGEESQALAFVETLKQMKPKAEVFAPVYKQVVEF